MTARREAEQAEKDRREAAEAAKARAAEKSRETAGTRGEHGGLVVGMSRQAQAAAEAEASGSHLPPRSKVSDHTSTSLTQLTDHIASSPDTRGRVRG